MPDATAPSKPCAICGKPAEPSFRPFCSARCADVDLNRWLSGGYVIPGRTMADDEEEARPVRRRTDSDE